MDSEALKPCPFCGGTDIKREYVQELFYAECGYCFAMGPSKGTPQEAITAWNTRADANTIEALQAENGRLEDAWEIQHGEKVKEREEARLWFEKAQTWKADNAKLREALTAASNHLEYCGYGDSWESECADAQGLPSLIEAALQEAG